MYRNNALTKSNHNKNGPSKYLKSMIETNVDETEEDNIIPLIDADDYTKVQQANELLPDPDAGNRTPPALRIEEIIEKDRQDYMLNENLDQPIIMASEDEDIGAKTFLSTKTLEYREFATQQETTQKIQETQESNEIEETEAPMPNQKVPDEVDKPPPPFTFPIPIPIPIPTFTTSSLAPSPPHILIPPSHQTAAAAQSSLLKRKNSDANDDLNPPKRTVRDDAQIVGTNAAHIVLSSFPNASQITREQIERDLTNTCLENQQILSQVAADLASDTLLKEFMESEQEKNDAYNEEEARRTKNTHNTKEREAQDHDAFYEDCTRHDIGNNIINKLIDLFVNLDNMTFGERTTYHMITSATNSALKVAFEKYWAFMNLPENKPDKLSILKTLACLIYSNFGNYAKQIFDPSSAASSGLKTARCYVLVVIIFWVVGRSIRAFQTHSKLISTSITDNVSSPSSNMLFNETLQQQQDFVLPRDQELFRPPINMQGLQNMQGMQNLHQQFNLRPQQYEIRPPNQNGFFKGGH